MTALLGTWGGPGSAWPGPADEVIDEAVELMLASTRQAVEHISQLDDDDESKAVLTLMCIPEWVTIRGCNTSFKASDIEKGKDLRGCALTCNPCQDLRPTLVVTTRSLASV